MVEKKHDNSAPVTIEITCQWTGIYRYELSIYWCILVCWALLYFWECCFVSNECRKRYYVWVTCRWWYSNTEYIPPSLLVFEMHNFLLVHTQYIQVCTFKLRTYEYILVCTSMYQYKPGSYKKHCSCTTGQDSRCKSGFGFRRFKKGWRA